MSSIKLRVAHCMFGRVLVFCALAHLPILAVELGSSKREVLTAGAQPSFQRKALIRSEAKNRKLGGGFVTDRDEDSDADLDDNVGTGAGLEENVVKHQRGQRSMNARDVSENPAETWEGCEREEWQSFLTEQDLKANAYVWPKDMCAAYLREWKATLFYDGDATPPGIVNKQTNIPMCAVAGAEDSFRNASSIWRLPHTRSLLDNVSIPKDGGPVVLLPVQNINRAEGTISTIANNLCSLQRVGLGKRTVLFLASSLESADRQYLQESFPDVAQAYDETLAERVESTHSVWLRWRYIPILLLLERGHQVLISDIDVVFISNPMPMFLARQADVAYTHEACMELNAGVGFYRPSEVVFSMLRVLLGMEQPRADIEIDGKVKNLYSAWGDDQSLLNCAAIDGIANRGLHLELLLSDTVRFSFSSLAKFFSDKCYGNASYAKQDWPYIFHTGCSSEAGKLEKLQKLGLWEVEEFDARARCVNNHDPMSQCSDGIDIPKNTLEDWLQAAS